MHESQILEEFDMLYTRDEELKAMLGEFQKGILSKRNVQ